MPIADPSVVIGPDAAGPRGAGSVPSIRTQGHCAPDNGSQAFRDWTWETGNKSRKGNAIPPPIAAIIPAVKGAIIIRPGS